jgi:excisionase family DNA binding protein
MYASLGQAAKATGLSRSTILRAIKAHRISAAKTDTARLGHRSRRAAPGVPTGGTGHATGHDAPSNSATALQINRTGGLATRRAGIPEPSERSRVDPAAQ